MSNAVNFVATKTGKARAVCEFCNRHSAAVRPDRDGEPDMWLLPAGWSQAPYPAEHTHRDGSKGSTWACPTCNKKLKAGNSLRVHESRRAF